MIPVLHTPCCSSTCASSKSITIPLASITKHTIDVRVCVTKPGVVDLLLLFVIEFGLVQLLLVVRVTRCFFSEVHFLLERSLCLHKYSLYYPCKPRILKVWPSRGCYVYLCFVMVPFINANYIIINIMSQRSNTMFQQVGKQCPSRHVAAKSNTMNTCNIQNTVSFEVLQ